MSFVREALAVTVLEALCPRASLASGIFPTPVGKLVFLEKVEAIDDLAYDQPASAIVINTNREDRRPRDKVGPPYNRTIEVEIIISVLTHSRDPEDPPDTLRVPDSDRTLFSSLNAIEQRVFFQLDAAPEGAHYRQLRLEIIGQISSEPARFAEDGRRFAERRITYTVRVPDDCFAPAPSAAPEGLDRLPQPLRRVAQDLMAAGYAAEIAQALAAAAPAAPVATPLAGVTLNIDISRPSDGTPDIVAHVPIAQA